MPTKATPPTKDMRLPPALFILRVDKRSVEEVATWRSLIHSDGLPTPFDKLAVAEVVAWRSRGRILRTAGLPLNLQQLERGRWPQKQSSRQHQNQNHHNYAEGESQADQGTWHLEEGHGHLGEPNAKSGILLLFVKTSSQYMDLECSLSDQCVWGGLETWIRMAFGNQ